MSARLTISCARSVGADSLGSGLTTTRCLADSCHSRLDLFEEIGLDRSLRSQSFVESPCKKCSGNPSKPLLPPTAALLLLGLWSVIWRRSVEGKCLACRLAVLGALGTSVWLVASWGRICYGPDD